MRKITIVAIVGLFFGFGLASTSGIMLNTWEVHADKNFSTILSSNDTARIHPIGIVQGGSSVYISAQADEEIVCGIVRVHDWAKWKETSSTVFLTFLCQWSGDYFDCAFSFSEQDNYGIVFNKLAGEEQVDITYSGSYKIQRHPFGPLGLYLLPIAAGIVVGFMTLLISIIMRGDTT